jgi:hypothetical protein
MLRFVSTNSTAGRKAGSTLQLGCAVIFTSKRNEAKQKRNSFRFDAKKSAFFAYFASMRNVEM